jgi:3-oxoacid CoA-transferase
MEVELTPQGTLAERLRAAKVGIPAFYTRAGFGTMVQQGGMPIKMKKGSPEAAIKSEPKPTHVFNGREYVLEEAIRGDFSFIKAYKADTEGNLVFKGTGNNFNQDIAGSSTITIAEVEEIVEVGQLRGEEIHVPGVYVDRIFKGTNFQRRLERVTNRKVDKKVDLNDVRVKIAMRIAKEVKDGMYLNLGIGIPTYVPDCIPAGVRFMSHTENGAIGVGPYPLPGEETADLINASKETITVLPGASFFCSSESFGIIRGGHLSLTILGSMQVAADGSIANWIIPGKKVKGMGGAMDLTSSPSKVIVGMEHTAKGEIKLLQECTLPLTAPKSASMVVTEKAVFERVDGRLRLKELAKGETVESVQKVTGFNIDPLPNLGSF